MAVLDGHEECVTSVVFSIDGQKLFSGSEDYTICVWNVQASKAVGEPLRGHSSFIKAVSVSPNGQLFASASLDGTVRVWSTSTLSQIHVLRVDNNMAFTSVAFSADGRYLISGLYEHTIKVWNVQTGEAAGAPLIGHTERVDSVAFSPNGYEFASGSVDGTIRVWDIRARTDVELYEGSGSDPFGASEEELRVRWNTNRTNMDDDGWVRDGDKLLMKVPWQYRFDIYSGTTLMIGPQVQDAVRPVVDYRRVFQLGGTRWRDIFTADG